MATGLILGLLVQPVIAAVGELQEGASTARMHAPAPDAQARASDAAAESGAPNPLEIVHHITHCCGHVAAIAAHEIEVAACAPQPEVARLEVTQAAPAGRWPAPFRPPIAG